MGLVTDSTAWLITLTVLTVSRYLLADVEVTAAWGNVLRNVGLVTLLAMALQSIGGYVNGLYRRKYVVGSLDEARVLTFLALGVTVILSAVVLATAAIPRSVILAMFPMALLIMGAVRLMFRAIVEGRSVPGEEALPALLYGAGELGHSVVRQMRVDPLSEFNPVGFIDDDPGKKGFVLNGLKVLGSGERLADLVEQTGAQAVVICLNRVDSTFLREIHNVTDPLGVRLLVFPSINEALNQRRNARSLRDVSVDDLVGRHPAEIDLSSVAGYLSGKRVLVTGAGGSIGSELCRQIHKYGPAELFMLDRDESGLHTTQISIFGHGLLDTKDAVLADIRDPEGLQRVFRDRQPEVVFHAAALKHLPMLEQYPAEAWKTNVLGTLNVLNASMDVGVERFVNISTDKAADPTSVLGHSKRMAERLTAWAARQDAGSYVSVRFGNVLGSRGSMLPTFQAQIEKGGPVTVTHPDVTRYFMTIPEACELVVQAGAIGEDGQVMILDMGEPVRILDVAKRMIEMSGKDVEIVFTGLRHGEKLHEDLFSVNEQVESPRHPRISHAPVTPASPSDLAFEPWLEAARDKSALVANEPEGPQERRSLSLQDEVFGSRSVG
ncbi:nucleoside-diphosphate sugar epimerase/dehydratase [Brachybacterium sp. p3-SID957]|uniref:polysaccharide biosynthesis protein n=1 Tax=Brachybacterium sp. p3-SID957 TaxID=2916049 RepID=UPI00223B7B5D|nr:nucleoside-diphosphate sugar epimerase/dehydratase [Brachybacterium sp. p3-SID957]MCT1777142.1 polysaccharide biosynthesis protein [Brachybacterium sp. p3-SID957]